MKSLIIKSILIFVLCGGLTANAGKKPLSQTRTAQCIVTIDLNSEFMQLEPDTVGYLLESPNVKGKAVTEILESGPEKVSLSWHQVSHEKDLSSSSLGVKISLSDDVKPAAKELLQAIIENLQEELLKGYTKYHQQLVAEREQVEEQLQAIKKGIAEQKKQQQNFVEVNLEKYFTAADLRTEEQLKQIVDLSKFRPDMPFAEAVDIIRNSTEPPLKIFVNWRNLYDNAEIDQSTPINMDTAPEAELGVGLKHLLEAVSGGFAELGYEIDNGVVAISTKESLSSDQITITYDVSAIGNADTLAQLITGAVAVDSWYDNGGEGTVTVYGDSLVIKQNKWTHRKIKELLQSVATDNFVDSMEVDSEEFVRSEKQRLENEKTEFDSRVRQMEAEKIAIEDQISSINQKIKLRSEEDPIILEIKQMMDNLKKIESDDKSTGLEVSEKIIQAQLQLAQRQQALVDEIGGDRLKELNLKLSDLTIKLAQYKAHFDLIIEQLQKVQAKLNAAHTINPQKLKIKKAKKALLEYEEELAMLKSVLDNSREPVVIALGID
jgi:hypothetical protein